jgi:hypothetical protein
MLLIKLTAAASNAPMAEDGFLKFLILGGSEVQKDTTRFGLRSSPLQPCFEFGDGTILGQFARSITSQVPVDDPQPSDSAQPRSRQVGLINVPADLQQAIDFSQLVEQCPEFVTLLEGRRKIGQLQMLDQPSMPRTRRWPRPRRKGGRLMPLGEVAKYASGPGKQRPVSQSPLGQGIASARQRLRQAWFAIAAPQRQT